MSKNLSILDLKSLTVIYDGKPVGTLVQTRDGVLAFEYSLAWIESGFSLNPLSLPLEREVFVARPHPLGGVFGVFDDSLPDGWGKLLVDRLLRTQGIDPYEISPLARLAIVGSSGMGALEYCPEVNLSTKHLLTDYDLIAEECATLLKTDYSDDLDTLFALGGSSGGARPKILTEIDGEDWIIKFASSYDSESIGKEEFQLSVAARSCGIEIPETCLFPSKTGPGYFGVKRFDRILGESGRASKIHMVSAGALLETSHRIPNLDYSILMRLTLKLTGSMPEVEKLYRLMCFNVLVGNRDDHAKNFSYLYDEKIERWFLSPAYDLTRNSGMNGEHATAVLGKGSAISCEDMFEVAIAAGIRPKVARLVFDEVNDVVASLNFFR